MELDQEAKTLEDCVGSLEPGDEVRVESGADNYSAYVLNKAKTDVKEDEQYILTLVPWDIKGLSYNQEFLSEYDVTSPEELSPKQVRGVSEKQEDLNLTEMPVRAVTRYSSEEGRGHVDDIEIAQSYEDYMNASN